MIASTARAAFLALALGRHRGNSAAAAGELADFNIAVEKAEAHNRVAVGYLRTGNIDLASLEVDRLREFWAKFNERFAGKRPAVFDGNAYYIIAMTDIATRLITADLMLHTGHPDVTRQALLAIRNDLYKLRRSAGVTVLADCVYDANNAMDTLMGFDGRELDWKSAETAFDIAGKTAVYDYVLGRCDAMAENRCARIRIPAADRWREGQHEIYSSGDRRTRYRSSTPRPDRVTFVRQPAGLPFRLALMRAAIDIFSLCDIFLPRGYLPAAQ